jgi:hypothetical protein
VVLLREEVMIPLGFCQCGCGQLTKAAVTTSARMGHVRGRPHRYVTGHDSKTGKGRGYVESTTRSAGVRTRKYAHIALVERARGGRPLPVGAEVHHVNEDKRDNRHGNLVVCQDGAYHRLLHQRTRALRACGNANYRKCAICKRYDDPGNMTRVSTRNQMYHKPCAAARKRQRKARSAA